MEHRSIYEQIAGRTDGTVYIGVVGPVRTGKSTFIKRFMEQLVLPNIENVYERERATDELPQSGSGRTIMTAEPKFVPNEAARVSPDGKTTLRVRLIDSVGYMIPGAVGDTEDGRPRMVTTPWAPEELPMAQAAELGTKKVMEDHSSLGVVVTTDGTVTDIPREDYREAEARAITDMQKTGKPFVVLVNTQSPGAAPAEALCAQLRSEYGVQALAMDCMHMQTQDIGRLLEAVMYAFPVEELRFFLPSWVRALPDGHPVKAALYDAMLERAGALTSLSEAESVLGTLQELEPVDEFRVREVDLGTGTVSCELHLPQALFYEELSRQAGVEIADAQAIEFVYVRVHGADGVALVDGQGHGLAGFAQHGGHILIRRGDAAADIGDHDDGIRQLNADLGLTAHEFQHIVVGAGLNTAGIHQGEGAAAPFAVAVDPVPGDAGGVLHNGGTAARQLVKQHGLAHIGPPHNGNQRLCHGQHILSQ